MKAALLLGSPTDWLSPSARSVARGLKSSHDLSFRLRNFMFAADLLHLFEVGLSYDRVRTGIISFVPVPAPGTVRNASITFRRGLGRTSGLCAASIQGYRWCSDDSRVAASFGEVFMAE